MNLERNHNIVELVGCYIFGVLLFLKIYILIRGNQLQRRWEFRKHCRTSRMLIFLGVFIFLVYYIYLYFIKGLICFRLSNCLTSDRFGLLTLTRAICVYSLSKHILS